MIKIGMGIGSAYFSSARSAGSASAPATLTITFGDGIDQVGEFILVINGIQYDGISNIGPGYSISTGTYDEESNFIPNSGEDVASSFQSYIQSNFAASLIVSRNVNVVTLTTIETNGASLYASCSLPMFPSTELVGSRYDVNDFTSGLGSAYAVGSGAESLFIAVSKTSTERWMFVMKIVNSDSITPTYSNYTNQATVNITAAMTQAQVSTALYNAAIAAGFTAVNNSTSVKITSTGFGNLADSVSAFSITTKVGYPELTSPAFVNAVFVSGAGSATANGLFILDGSSGGKTKYTNDNDVSFVYVTNKYEIKLNKGIGSTLYSSTTIPNNSWNAIYAVGASGSGPPPTVLQATTADGIASQRLTEQFEAPGATDWTSDSLIPWNDQSIDNPILGSYSALIQGDNASSINVRKDFTASSSCYMRFQFRVNTPGFAYANDQILCSFLDSAGNTLCSIALANSTGRFRLVMPGALSTNVNLTASVGVNYYGWLEYERGTGTNAICRVGWSTSPNRPTNWPSNSASGSLVAKANGTVINNASRVRFGYTNSVTYNYTIDDIQIRPTPFD